MKEEVGNKEEKRSGEGENGGEIVSSLKKTSYILGKHPKARSATKGLILFLGKEFVFTVQKTKNIYVYFLQYGLRLFGEKRLKVCL